MAAFGQLRPDFGSPMRDANDAPKCRWLLYCRLQRRWSNRDSKTQPPYGYAETPKIYTTQLSVFEWEGFQRIRTVLRCEQCYPCRSSYQVSVVSWILFTIWVPWWSKRCRKPGSDYSSTGWLNPITNNGTQFMFDGSYIRLKTQNLHMLSTEIL